MKTFAPNTQKKQKSKLRKFTYAFAVFIFTFGGLALQIKLDQNHIVVDQFTLSSAKIPKVFDGFKIVHLSDLHGAAFKDGQKTLLTKIKAENPDLIVISGDTLDRHIENWENSLSLLTELAKSYPVYASTGNHEYWTPHRDQTLKTMENTGVQVLAGNGVSLRRPATLSTAGGTSSEAAQIWLYGIHDPNFFDSDDAYLAQLAALQNEQAQISGNQDFVMLISHRPELQKLYASYGFDLSFSGHAHGGQVRLPFTQGLIAPNQGLLPKLTAGLHEFDGKYLMISRGIGNPSGVPRVFNPPEIVSLTLKSVD